MKTTNKEYTKSERPQSGFYNVLLQRIYNKVDGIDVNKIDKVIEVLTISQLKELAVDVSKYGIKNDQGLACRFENTRNYCFPVDAMSKLLDAADHAEFKKNYDRAVKELQSQIEAEKKAKDPVRKAVMSVINAAVKTEAEKKEEKQETVKKVIADVIQLNAAKTESVKAEKAPAKTEVKKVVKAEKKTVKAPDPVSEVKAVAPVEQKKEEKKQENKPVDPVVTKSVTIDSNYIENLIAAAPSKKTGKKKSIKKSDLEQIAALF